MAAGEGTARRATDLGTDALHLFGLAGFAVAQPLFDTISRAPEFFFVGRYHWAVVVLAALLPSLVLPSLLIGIELLAAVCGGWLRRIVHAAFVALLAAVAALPPLNRTVPLPAPGLLSLAAVLAVALTAVYLRSGMARRFLTVLSPLALAFPILFLFDSPLREAPVSAGAVTAPERRMPEAGPIVMVVFDEFPTTALVDHDWRIDASRYPHFAALAAKGTWFRNATTVASITPPAVGAMLTGIYPDPRAPGLAAQRRGNLFTLLGGLYDLRVSESYVRFCPDALCAPPEESKLHTRVATLARDLSILFLHLIAPQEARGVLPDLSQPFLLLRNLPIERASVREGLELLARQKELNEAQLAYRAEEFSRFVNRIDSPRALYYHHALLPHAPYVYLPNGSICTPGLFAQPTVWPTDPWVVVEAYQRFLLQVQYVDRLIGDLIGHLEQTGLYDSALLIVTADHGVSHRTGDQRRAVTKTNFCDIMAVPLFVKAPHQREGRTVDRNVEIIDVLPTIADALDVSIPWPVDGRSALDATSTERPEKTLTGPNWPGERPLIDAEGRARFPPSVVETCREGDGRRFSGGWEVADPFRPGPHGSLVGRRLTDTEVGGAPRHRVSIARAGLYEHVDPAGEFVPCSVAGRASIATATAPLELAVAVNGTIRGVTQTSTSVSGWAPFAMTVPPDAFVPGKNAVQVLVMEKADGGVRLTPTLGGSGTTYVMEDASDGSWLRVRSETPSSIPVRPGEVAGEVERLAGGGRDQDRFKGWAADARDLDVVEAIVVFVDGTFYQAEAPGLPRPDVEKRYGRPALLNSGFEFKLPVSRNATADRGPAIRVFAISKRAVASELLFRSDS